MYRTIPISCLVFSLFATAGAVAAKPEPTILTNNVVELRETLSPQGFVHPGISCNAETLAIMREKVLQGVSPWVDYFEGMRRTRFADLKERPKLVGQITDDPGIGAFAHDAQLAWAQTILYVVTGDEAYRKTPLEIVRWYGSRTDESFFPQYFTDSHIKIGKYVYTLASAADILRATTPKNAKLAVTPAMIDALQQNCLLPIRKNCIERNDYFMNQHSYAIMGFLASTILGDEVEDYKRAVEWTTVNATSPNQGRNGSIKQQIRLVTRNDKTGEAVPPNLQLVEMGRDMAHAEGNLTNLLMMSKTIDFQKTKVDPVSGTVSDKADGVSPIHFLDDRLPKGAALFAKYNLGYGLPWIPTYTETDPKHPDYLARFDQPSWRGGIGGSGFVGGYYYYKTLGLDMESGPLQYIKVAFDATAASRESVRSGGYLDTLHNYGFDFWIGLPAAASGAAPDPEKAKRALATVLPPLEITYNGIPVQGQQFEYHFVDLSAHAQPGDIYPGSPMDIPLKVVRDADGTGYVRMTLEKEPRSMAVFASFPAGSGLRVRSDNFVKLDFYGNEDYAKQSPKQTIYLPNTRGEWKYVTINRGGGGRYIQATPMDGAASLDFDRIDTEAAKVLPLSFDVAEDSKSFPTYAGAKLEKDYTATYADKRLAGETSVGSEKEKIEYAARNLPVGAALDGTSGKFTWTPSVNQAGDHTLYITAQTPVSLKTIRVDIHVAKNLQAALDYVARVYDPKEKYESATVKAFKAALQTKDLATVRKAADQLALLNPRLADGSLDYRMASAGPERGLSKMADNDPLSWGGLWGFDKNVTMDFGNHFKVKSEAFRIQCRDGFPIRVAESVVYGSNDRKHWTLLTENKAKASAELQTLTVKEEERDKPYRYIRLFMPAKPFPIFEIAEFRIVGERIEDYSPDQRVAYISGYADGTFRPDQKLTKAEAVSLLAGLVDDYTDKGVYECAFVDVLPAAPYFDDVAYMSSKKLVSADGDKRFHPDALITRGQLAAIMARMQAPKRKDGPAALEDVRADTPHATDGAFRPNAPVTRAEFVVAVNRMSGRAATEQPREGLPKFSDVSASHWAYADIMRAATTYPLPSAPASTASPAMPAVSRILMAE
ncbi:MAG: S-layer homology domain-containing protein [Chthoniobacterales bacterium]